MQNQTATTPSNSLKNERGSLALEQVLFIGAAIALSVGIFTFYEGMRGYFEGVSIGALPTTVTNPAGTSNP
jgi:hypothetical protein